MGLLRAALRPLRWLWARVVHAWYAAWFLLYLCFLAACFVIGVGVRGIRDTRGGTGRGS